MNFWQTEKIKLRGIEPEDAATFHSWNQNSEMARHLDWVWPPVALAQVKDWTQKQALKSLDNGCFHWVIENSQGVPVGAISTHRCDARAGTFSYGLSIAPQYQRQGYAQAAIELVLRYYFEELRYQKVTVSVHSDNAASLSLHRKLGFQLEGVLRRTVFTHGAFFDEHWFGLTVEEWQKG